MAECTTTVDYRGTHISSTRKIHKMNARDLFNPVGPGAGEKIPNWKSINSARENSRARRPKRTALKVHAPKVCIPEVQ